MARFSVWNYATHSYDYYEGRGNGKTHAGTPPKARGAAALGATPEQAAWPLPAGARHVGSGTSPQGQIASTGADPDPGSIPMFVKVGAGIGAAYLLWRKFR